MNRKISMSLFLALALLLPATVLVAQTDSTASSELIAQGTVVSSTASALVIEKADHTRLTFVISPQSNIPPGLLPGSSVTVTYSDQGAGQLQAASVNKLGSAQATPPPPAEATSAYGTTATSAATDESLDTDPNTPGVQREALPSTASPLPLFGLIGLAALIMGLGFRSFRQRVEQS